MPTEQPTAPGKPSVLFVCLHNAGRSQMAAGFVTHLAGDMVVVRSAGTQPTDAVNSVVVSAMGELGIDLADEMPKVLTMPAVEASDYVITMGCGDECPWFPGKTYLDWELDDPAGQDIVAVRAIRDQIRARVEALLDDVMS